MNDAGLNIIGFVHYKDANYPNIWPNNAQWDLTSKTMRYGDGDGINFYPLVALDIVAHEMGHGICQFTANLNYPATNWPESAALNEGFSDIWAACVKYWATPNDSTWLIGNKVVRGSFNCIRNLKDPTSNLTAETPGLHPNTYRDNRNHWDVNNEPHRNSTVLSHWFYLLCQGGSGTNEINNTYNVSGIGINKAQRIVYEAERYYLNSSANYNAARNATISSAKLWYGEGSSEYIAVINAWYAVGVGDMYPPVISGPNIICPMSNVTYTLVGKMNNNPITWTCSSNITLVSASGNNATFGTTATSPQVGAVWASFSGTTISKTVYIINNPAPTSQNSVSATTNINYTIAPQTPDINTYRWVVQPSTGVVVGATSGLTLDVRFTQAGTYQIFAYGTSRCGASVNPTHIYIYNVSSSTGSYSSTVPTFTATAYPNPVSSALSIEITENAVASDNAQTNLASVNQNKIDDFKISLYDEHGKLVHHANAKKGKKAHFSVAHLKNGIYYLNIHDESTGQTEKRQIVVKH